MKNYRVEMMRTYEEGAFFVSGHKDLAAAIEAARAYGADHPDVKVWVSEYEKDGARTSWVKVAWRP